MSNWNWIPGRTLHETASGEGWSRLSDEMKDHACVMEGKILRAFVKEIGDRVTANHAGDASAFPLVIKEILSEYPK